MTHILIAGIDSVDPVIAHQIFITGVPVVKSIAGAGGHGSACFLMLLESGTVSIAKTIVADDIPKDMIKKTRCYLSHLKTKLNLNPYSLTTD